VHDAELEAGLNRYAAGACRSVGIIPNPAD
jgi:hypothetical protein